MKNFILFKGFPGGSVVKNPPTSAGFAVPFPGLGRALEEEMATHSNTGESHGQGTLMGYRPWGHKESWTVACQAPPSMGFSRQEYWSGLPFPPAGDLPDPGTEPGSPAMRAYSLLFEPPGKPRTE